MGQQRDDGRRRAGRGGVAMARYFSMGTGLSLSERLFLGRVDFTPNAEVGFAGGARLSSAAAGWEDERPENFCTAPPRSDRAATSEFGLIIVVADVRRL